MCVHTHIHTHTQHQFLNIFNYIATSLINPNIVSELVVLHSLVAPHSHITKKFTHNYFAYHTVSDNKS